MNRKNLIKQIEEKESLLCVGLDVVIEKMPEHIQKLKDPIFEFNKQIIDATADLCVAYKPNTAFYEALGTYGWESLEKTIEYIPNSHFTIADAKRGDIGNTSKMYAKAFFENMNCDSITVAPYMGSDSVQPFLSYEDKWIIILGLTSNKGSMDFQKLNLNNNKSLYQEVLVKCASWGSIENTMFVIGATHPDDFKGIREIIPEHFLLVPGVGAQGGSVEGVCKYGLGKEPNLLINSSRSIIYASNDVNFAKAAQSSALILQIEMAKCLQAL